MATRRTFAVHQKYRVIRRVIQPRQSCVDSRRHRFFPRYVCMRAFCRLCYALYHLTHASLSFALCRFPKRMKNRHVRHKYIAHVGAVTKDVSANLPRKGNFLHFSPRASIELGIRGSFPFSEISRESIAGASGRDRGPIFRFFRHSGEK